LESQADWLARVDSGEIARNGEDSLFGEGCGSLLGGARGRLAAGPFFGLRTPQKAVKTPPWGQEMSPALADLKQAEQEMIKKIKIIRGRSRHPWDFG
jgi:hypothetical protein